MHGIENFKNRSIYKPNFLHRMSYQLASPLSAIQTKISSQLSKFQTSICRPKFGLRTFYLPFWIYHMPADRSMAQEVSRRPLTSEARVRSQFSLCGICGGQSGTGTGLSSSTSLFSVSIIPPSLHTHSMFSINARMRARTDYRTLVDTPATFHFPHIHAHLRI
jgi:hypothetical protein